MKYTEKLERRGKSTGENPENAVETCTFEDAGLQEVVPLRGKRRGEGSGYTMQPELTTRTTLSKA